MDPVYSIGIHSLWDELRHMPTGGVWWINVDRRDDAISLVNQTLSAQHEDAQIAVVVMGEAPKKIIKLENNSGPESVLLFSMPDHENSLHFMCRDLLCSLDPNRHLIILLCPQQAWENISSENQRQWLEKSYSWAKYHKCTLLIVNHGNNNDLQHSLLMNEFRSLFGLAALRYENGIHLFDIAFWCNEKGVSARQQLILQHKENGWQLAPREEANIQPRSDEKTILSHISVLEGAPALSEHWTLFDTNEDLFNAARTAQAATLIFSVAQNKQIEPLAHNFHTLRRQRGSALKIVVRENQASLRAIDERLLLGCGANMVIPWNAPLSRCLTLLESVQGQQFNRHVPEDITTLLTMTQPLKLRGYQKWDRFCDAVSNMMNNPLLTDNGRGVMVALRPVPGIRLEQALTLFRPNRVGDIITLGDNRLVLFLSLCRVNELDTALNHIFPLPTADIFSSRMSWFEDNQIAAEILQMRTVTPEQWVKPLAVTTTESPVINAEHDGHSWRRIPTPHRLLSDATEHTS